MSPKKKKLTVAIIDTETTMRNEHSHLIFDFAFVIGNVYEDNSVDCLEKNYLIKDTLKDPENLIKILKKKAKMIFIDTVLLDANKSFKFIFKEDKFLLNSFDGYASRFTKKFLQNQFGKENKLIDIAVLRSVGLINKNAVSVKLLAKGSLASKVKIEVSSASEKARQAVEKMGGELNLISS